MNTSSAPIINLSEATVFLVDDEAVNLLLVGDLFHGMNLKSYSTRVSARYMFDLVEQGTVPDLILLDIQLPHRDGYVVLTQIRAHPRLRATKVVAVTANVMPENIERARNAGFDGFLGKPLAVARFPSQIQRILAGEAVWEPQ